MIQTIITKLAKRLRNPSLKEVSILKYIPATKEILVSFHHKLYDYHKWVLGMTKRDLKNKFKAEGYTIRKDYTVVKRK
jgi:hypothetical protein